MTGYKKPPEHTRFKKGQSGNPKGRPKGKLKAPRERLEEELRKKVTVVENGKRQVVTKLDVIIMNLVNNAAKADKKALDYLFKGGYLSKAEAAEPTKFAIKWID